MDLLALLLVVLLTLFITGLFVFVLGARGPGGKIWTFFLVLFLVIWAADLWVTPYGPEVWGVTFVPLFVIGFIVALLIAAAQGAKRKSDKEIQKEDKDYQPENVNVQKMDESSALGAIFWVLLILLFIAIGIGLFA